VQAWSVTPLGAQAERPPSHGAKQALLGAQAERPPSHGVTHSHLGAQAGRPPTHGVKPFNLGAQAERPPSHGVTHDHLGVQAERPPTPGVKPFILGAPPEARPQVGFAPPEPQSPNKRPILSTNSQRMHSTNHPEPANLGSPDPAARGSKRKTVLSPFGVDPVAPNLRTKAGVDRNAVRLEQANKEDTKTLGENRGQYLSSDPNAFLPEPVIGPDDSFPTPDWFLEELRILAETDCIAPTKPDIMFEVSMEAAQHNADLLRHHECNIARFLDGQRGATLDFGSEFRPAQRLRPLLGGHPNFDELEEVITNGMPYRYVVELEEEQTSKEVSAQIQRGNHKPAQANPEQVGMLLAKDVAHGFAMVVPTDVVPLIPGAMVQPTGLAEQWVLDNNGKRKVKYRITQDLTYAETAKEEPISVNSRIDMKAYPEMIYGWCLPRIIHFIVALRLAWPGKSILIAKYDYSDAYRWIAHSAKAALAQTITTLGALAFVCWRLTFGGSPNPPTWCCFSEIVTDLANEISMCAEWDPATLKSPDQTVTPDPIPLGPEIPVASALPMAVTIPPVITGRVDGFIDDLINVFLDTLENCRRQAHVVPLAMFVTSRPHAGDTQEPILRRAILSMEKLATEGTPEEIQIVLGWLIDTRRLLAALPQDKSEAWLNSLDAIISTRNCLKEALESLEGQLKNHASFVIPLARALKNSRSNKQCRLCIKDEPLADFVLWPSLLAKAHAGISMNLIVTRRPDRIVWYDSCPFGIGGFRLHNGRAWRIRIPSTSMLYGSNRINNLLEFLGMAVNIWLECLNQAGDSHSCILALGDNTSAVGWLHNSSRLDTKLAAHSAHLIVARKVAQLVLDADCCLASQHLKGDLNFMADLLLFAGSRARAVGKRHPIAFDDPPNDILTQRFHLYYPEQIPKTFAISQLPSEILYWVSSVLQTAALTMIADRKTATKTRTEPGADDRDSAQRQAYRQSGTNYSVALSSHASAVLAGPQVAYMMASALC
jgi:hypothetical protein